MGSKDRMPPNLRRPQPGPGMRWSDPFAREHPPPHPLGPFFDGLPPPEIMEQNLGRQHMEMQKLAFENEKLATTHSVLRQQLVAAQQERQRLDAEVASVKAEREQHMRALLDKMARMEADLQSSEPLKVELQQSCVEVEKMAASRQELISKVQQLAKDMEKNHMDAKQIPLLLSELDGLRQEYQNCRMTYDHEKKVYENHLESIQMMEKKYASMSKEMEKLRAEWGRLVGSATHKANEAHGVQNAYHDGYGSLQGRGPHQFSTSPYGGPGPTAHMGSEVPRGPSHGNTKSLNYDGSKDPRFDPSGDPRYNSRATNYGLNRTGSLEANGYDASRGAAGYDDTQGVPYDAQRAGYVSRGGAGGYDNQQAAGYDGSKTSTGYDYEAMRVATGYDHPRSGGYNDARGAVGTQAQAYDAPKVADPGTVPRASGGAGYHVPAGAEYDGSGGSAGGRQPAYAGPYGSASMNFTSGGAPYRGGNAQR